MVFAWTEICFANLGAGVGLTACCFSSLRAGLLGLRRVLDRLQPLLHRWIFEMDTPCDGPSMFDDGNRTVIPKAVQMRGSCVELAPTNFQERGQDGDRRGVLLDNREHKPKHVTTCTRADPFREA